MSMKPVIIPSPHYESAYLTRSKLAEKVESRVSGVQEKHRCSLNDTRNQAADTKTDGVEKTTEVTQVLDQAKVAHQIRQAFDARVKGHWGALSAIQGYPCALVQRICRNYAQEESRHEKGQTVFITA